MYMFCQVRGAIFKLNYMKIYQIFDDFHFEVFSTSKYDFGQHTCRNQLQHAFVDCQFGLRW